MGSVGRNVGAVAEPKTKPTDASVADFLAAIENVHRRADSVVVDEMMRAATGHPPVLWGTSIVGYGSTSYRGSTGKEAQWPIVAFSPRKANLVLYLNSEIAESVFDKLGKHRRGVGCLYLKKLADVDVEILRALIKQAAEADQTAAAPSTKPVAE